MPKCTFRGRGVPVTNLIGSQIFSADEESSIRTRLRVTPGTRSTAEWSKLYWPGNRDNAACGPHFHVCGQPRKGPDRAKVHDRPALSSHLSRSRDPSRRILLNC